MRITKLFGLAGVLLMSAACSASNDAENTFANVEPKGGENQNPTGAQGGGGGAPIFGNDGGNGGEPPVVQNPCGTKCGPVELCEGEHLGLDDNCDGEVDENCGCVAGQAQACFKGDPSFRNVEGCFPGTQKCGESGQWGSCLGGTHATDEEKCYASDGANCHPIKAPPFVSTDLSSGLGAFGSDATPNSEKWTVTCPDGVTPCPSVTGRNFAALQSGEYTVKYTKVNGSGETKTCEYPLYVGSPGLRIELSWEYKEMDVDLHLLRPTSVSPWNSDTETCYYGNCDISDLSSSSTSSIPTWFSDVASPPAPVNWYLDPVEENNTCYFAPRGVGADWKAKGKGCHNPRLDLDNTGCDLAETDINDPYFCAPENINVDFPPNKQWMRIGVHYFGSDLNDPDIHPTVKVFCDSALVAELGPQGYYTPQQPVTFTEEDGDGEDERKFWEVADVAWVRGDNQCVPSTCVVKPLYGNTANKTPQIRSWGDAQEAFGPAYPPPVE